MNLNKEFVVELYFYYFKYVLNIINNIKIFDAPTRHADTLITDLQKYTERLLMFSRVASCIHTEV